MTPIDKNKGVTIAILPFTIISSDERLKTLYLGFVEDLTINFSKFIGLSVISKFSTSHIKDASNYKEIKKLNADFIITGSIRVGNEKSRISIQLINTQDNSIVFAENLDELIENILDTQDKIIQQIVNVLQQEINYNLLSYSYEKNLVDLAAYENYLLGMDSLKKGTVESDEIARNYFNNALKINPNYALAYTGLSLSYFNEWSCQLWERWDVSQKGAQKYALKAIEIDKNDYKALAVLGRTFLYSNDFDKAEHYLRKSLRMNPSDASNLMLIAFSLMYLGYSEEALSLYKRAKELNPLNKENYYPYGSNFYFELGEFKKSTELGKNVVLERCWVDFPAYIAAAYFHLSNYEQMWEYWNIYLTQFEKQIYTGKESLEKEALQWQIEVNPYKGETNLKPFWEYIKTSKDILIEDPQDQKKISPGPSFIKKGNSWELYYLGETVLLKDMKGNYDIAKLLQQPNKEFHCMDLMEAYIDEKGSIKTIDNKAKNTYLKKIKELKEDMDPVLVIVNVCCTGDPSVVFPKCVRSFVCGVTSLFLIVTPFPITFNPGSKNSICNVGV